MQVPFDSIKQQVWDEIRQALRMSNQTESFWDNLQAFAHAVDWQASCSRSSSSRTNRISEMTCLCLQLQTATCSIIKKTCTCGITLFGACSCIC